MFFAVVIFSQCSYFTEMQKQREKVYNDLKTLCDSLPTSEGLRKTNSNEVIKPERGSLTNSFLTNSDCKTVVEPYYKHLASKGWLPTAEGSPYYYKENYIIDVTCRQQLSDPNERFVQVTCGWDKYGKDKDVFK